MQWYMIETALAASLLESAYQYLWPYAHGLSVKTGEEEFIIKAFLFTSSPDYFMKKLQKFLDHDYSHPNFPLKHLIKDIGLFKQVAEESGIEAGIADAMQEVFLKGLQAGYGDEDYSALYEAINPGFDAETDTGC